MPIFMGLYFCLQESVFFRLQEFLWIPNLAAPDMLVWWSESIPLISSPGNRFGDFSFLYLGPFFNLLPIFAVAAVLGAAEADHAAADERHRGTAAEDDEVHAHHHGAVLLQGGGRAVPVLHRQRAVDAGRAEADPEAEGEIAADARCRPRRPGGRRPSRRCASRRACLGRLQERLKERMEEMQQQAEGKRQIVNKPQAEGPPRPTAAERAQQRKNKKKK